MANARRSWSAAGIGLALIVALAGCGGTASGDTHTATTPAAPTVAPTQTPSPPGVWSSLNGCGSYVPDALQVRYQQTPGSYGIQRSTDCGASWSTVASPQIPGVSDSKSIAYWGVSPAPAYPDTVLLTAQINGDTRLCSADVCQVQYVSTDGGQTWARLKLPAPGFLDDLIPEEPLASAIGTRLYGIVTDELIMVGPGGNSKSPIISPPARLVVSADHGATWKLCDAAIAAHGQQVAQYAAPPTGSDLYVISIPSPDTSASPPETVWVSHDVGATWSESGPTPGTGTAATRGGDAGGEVNSVFASANTNANGSTLYLDVVVQGQERAMASMDGGHTWQGDSKLIFHADSQGYSPTLIGTLPDGSLLVEYPNGDGETVAWKPGAPPRTVAGNPGFRDFFHPLIVPAPTGTGFVLWLSGDTGPDAIPGVKYTQLEL